MVRLGDCCVLRIEHVIEMMVVSGGMVFFVGISFFGAVFMIFLGGVCIFHKLFFGAVLVIFWYGFITTPLNESIFCYSICWCGLILVQN